MADVVRVESVPERPCTVNSWTLSEYDDCRTALRSWRDSNTRRSAETVEIWEFVLSRRPHDLDDELWVVYEQVCVSALDCGRLDIANDCIDALIERFGDQSLRIGKLRAMRYEMTFDYEKAMQLYDVLVEREPTNTSYRKRRVAVLKAQGRVDEAIARLNEYLQTFINDNEAWLELSNMYLSQMDYARAAHCMEELILSQPMNSHYSQRYADMRYAQGGLDNVELAKQYYVHAAKANATNLRAHFGILHSCNWLATKATGQKRKDLVTLAKWAVDNIRTRYTACPVETSSIADVHVKAALAILEAMQSSEK